MSNPNDTASTQNDSNVQPADATGKSEPTVIVDPSVLDDGKTATPAAAATTDSAPKVEKTEAMPIPPVASVGNAGDAAVPPAAPAAGKDDEEDTKVPLNDGKTLKYGLGALAVLGVLGLFLVGYLVMRNSASTAPTVVIPAAAPAAPAPGEASGPAATLPEVRTPAPRLIDATGCRRGQYRIEGNQLVFTNCATLELSETAR